MAGSLAGSKLNFRSCRRSSWARTWPRQTSHGGPAARRRSVVKRAGLYLPSVYLDASGPAPARDRRYPLEGRRPHVKLDLFAHPKSVVKQIRESVLAACPALDLEDDNPVFLVCPELDLPGLQMGLKRRQPEHRSLALHYANWAVPGTGHSNYVLIVHRLLAGRARPPRGRSRGFGRGNGDGIAVRCRALAFGSPTAPDRWAVRAVSPVPDCPRPRRDGGAWCAIGNATTSAQRPAASGWRSPGGRGMPAC